MMNALTTLDRRISWRIAGILLIASAITLGTPVPLIPSPLVPSLLQVSALVLLGWGGGSGGNIVGGKRSGTIALAILAVWTGLTALVIVFWASFSPLNPALLTLWTAFGFLHFALLAIVAVQVGQNRALLLGWRWVPLAILAATAVISGITAAVAQADFGAFGPATSIMTGLSALVSALAPALIGILALLTPVPSTDTSPRQPESHVIM
ncbi:hypothetical protein M2390_002399 [Mycetocola sp. BIGb0189]|uniref:hypothetical protein n=1 Tax=Mycetocola sp. BIGb0189 TaxID=2940604 RepID=UPI002168C5DF|nr:hypothetical protein [Mycetocola sp. BIGb0189]MCS4277195.1 hypothetical protein [Mycetocola sp. BIGb0189]